MLVAMAAPISPQWKTAMKSQSSTMFSTPPITDSSAPSPARPTVMKLSWNTMPNTAKGLDSSTGTMYSRQ